jgi:hypothetical protein
VLAVTVIAFPEIRGGGSGGGVGGILTKRKRRRTTSISEHPCTCVETMNLQEIETC